MNCTNLVRYINYGPFWCGLCTQMLDLPKRCSRCVQNSKKTATASAATIKKCKPVLFDCVRVMAGAGLRKKRCSRPCGRLRNAWWLSVAKIRRSSKALTQCRKSENGFL